MIQNGGFVGCLVGARGGDFEGAFVGCFVGYTCRILSGHRCATNTKRFHIHRNLIEQFPIAHRKNEWRLTGSLQTLEIFYM